MQRRGEMGLTLLEVVITISILAILASILAPNVGQFLPKAKQDAYLGDQKNLQTAISGYFLRNGAYPTYAGQTGSPSASLNSYIDSDLLTAGRFTVDRPRSSNSYNGGTGTYGWYVDAQGRAQSIPTFTPGVYP
ncbi:MAG: type II secretion system protein [Chloroflexota bacterium]